MNENQKELYKKFLAIKKLGYIKSDSKNKNHSGILLEKMLDIKSSDYCIPDFKDIEIKVVRNYHSAGIDLFSCSPDGRIVFPIKYISEKYGYPDKEFKNINVLKGNIYANKYSKIGKYFYFKLKIDNSIETITIEIFDNNYKLIDNSAVWDFETLKKRLFLKLKYLAIITVQKLYSNNNTFFHFSNLNFYELISFEQFINAIESGHVYFVIKTGVNKIGVNAGKFHDYGTSIRINKNDLIHIFKYIDN